MFVFSPVATILAFKPHTKQDIFFCVASITRTVKLHCCMFYMESLLFEGFFVYI